MYGTGAADLVLRSVARGKAQQGENLCHADARPNLLKPHARHDDLRSKLTTYIYLTEKRNPLSGVENSPNNGAHQVARAKCAIALPTGNNNSPIFIVPVASFNSLLELPACNSRSSS